MKNGEARPRATGEFASVADTEERKLAVARALARDHDLTPTQSRLLLLVATGATRSEIVEETGSSLRTVKNHLEAIFDKLERVIPQRSARAIENWILDQALYDAVIEQTSPGEKAS